jgi:hypothetical protein
MPFIECPFDIFQPSPPTLRLELRSIHFWPAGASEPGFKLCGTTLANPCDGNATALEVEGAKQFQIGQYLDPMRGAETPYFFREEISIPGTDDIGVSCQCGTEHGFVRWISQQLLRHG